LPEQLDEIVGGHAPREVADINVLRHDPENPSCAASRFEMKRLDPSSNLRTNRARTDALNRRRIAAGAARPSDEFNGATPTVTKPRPVYAQPTSRTIRYFAHAPAA